MEERTNGKDTAYTINRSWREIEQADSNRITDTWIESWKRLNATFILHFLLHFTLT